MSNELFFLRHNKYGKQIFSKRRMWKIDKYTGGSDGWIHEEGMCIYEGLTEKTIFNYVQYCFFQYDIVFR